MLSLLAELTALESPSDDKAAVDRLGLHLEQTAADLGAVITRHPRQESGEVLLCTWGSARAGKPVLLLAHMDTVFPLGTVALRPFRQEDGKVFGPGTLDMKAGIVQALTALRYLSDNSRLPRPVRLLLTPDEEIGSFHSRSLIEEEAREAACVFVLEPASASGALKTSRKATGCIRIEVRGQAAHAGINHAAGRNAIQELAWQILQIQNLTDYASGTTVNVGVIGGGTKPNVVPDHAWAEADFRILSLAELARLKNWAANATPHFPGTSLTISVESDRPPMPRDELMAASFTRAQQIAARMGLQLTETATGGGSDGNFISPLGIPLLDGLGPVGDGAHSENEFFTVSSWLERTSLLANLIESF